MKNAFIAVVMCYLFQFSVVKAQQVEWFSSTVDNRWKKEKQIKISDKDPNIDSDIEIKAQKAQVIEGFGGCFNELGWDALMVLDELERTKIMENLFGENGANFTYNRTPIGANDFSRNWYSLNETDGDFEMKNFSIERDQTGLIPYIKAAKKVNPTFKLWACPWSPPVWMKTTKHYATAAGDHNDFTEKNEVKGDHFIQEPKYLEAYALYFSKYIDAYKENGIDIAMLQFQNEPYTVHQWPNCNWTPPAMVNFIGKYLGPTFSKEHPNVELWFGTFNCNKMEDLDRIMQDKDASKYIKGIGLQWEGKDIISEIHTKYPTVKIMQTESECGNGSNSWESAEYTWSLINHYISNGASNYSYWNMILDHTGKSTWGWVQNSLISIDTNTKEVTYNPEYYIMKHLSHYVQPGAYLLETSGGSDHLAFVNPDGNIVLVVVNMDDKDKKTKIGVDGKILEFNLKAKSFNTLQYTRN